MPKLKKGPKAEGKLLEIVRAMRRGSWYRAQTLSYENQKALEEFNIIEAHEGFNLSEVDTLKILRIFSDKITLGEVLEYIRKKFRLKTITPQITQTVAMWRFKHDDLFEQWNYCIDWIYYLVMVKKPHYDKRNTNQKDGME